MFKIIDPNKYPIKISKDKNFKIIVISDTHIGGRTGYLPSNCKHERGEKHPQTPDQKKMEKNLLTSLENVGEIDILIFLGDMVDGKNSSAGGLDIGNVNVDIQIEWATLFGQSVINQLKPKKILGLHGSDYHVDDSSDKQLIYRLSLLYPDINFYYGYPSLKFYLGDKLWYLQHKFASGVSKLGTLERYWKNIHNMSWDRGRTPDVIGYAHLHKAQNPTQIKNGKNPVYGFVAPCQKMPDVFCSKGPLGAFWEIGYLNIEQNGRELNGKYVNTYRYWETKQ